MCLFFPSLNSTHRSFFTKILHLIHNPHVSASNWLSFSSNLRAPNCEGKGHTPSDRVHSHPPFFSVIPPFLPRFFIIPFFPSLIQVQFNILAFSPKQSRPLIIISVHLWFLILTILIISVHLWFQILGECSSPFCKVTSPCLNFFIFTQVLSFRTH